MASCYEMETGRGRKTRRYRCLPRKNLELVELLNSRLRICEFENFRGDSAAEEAFQAFHNHTTRGRRILSTEYTQASHLNLSKHPDRRINNEKAIQLIIHLERYLRDPEIRRITHLRSTTYISTFELNSDDT